MLALLCWEFLTFQLAPTLASEQEAWMQNLILHASIILILTLSSLAGGMIGFYFLPAVPVIRKRVLIGMGAIDAILSAMLAPTVFISAGSEFAALSALVIASLFTYFGGRVLSNKVV